MENNKKRKYNQKRKYLKEPEFIKIKKFLEVGLTQKQAAEISKRSVCLMVYIDKASDFEDYKLQQTERYKKTDSYKKYHGDKPEKEKPKGVSAVDGPIVTELRQMKKVLIDIHTVLQLAKERNTLKLA